MSRRNKNNNQVMTTDAFSNPVFRLGYGSQAPLEATDYVLTRMTDNYAKLNAMYRSGGILQSVVDIIPEDMCREWFTLSGDIKPEDMDALEKAQRKIGLRRQINEGLRWGRLYGGAAGVLLIKGQDKWDKPLDVDAVMPDSFMGLFILDRWSGIFPGAELVTDFGDPDFGLPEFYDISTGEGTNIVARVHHSRVVRFTGRDLPYLEKLAEMYWGESEIEPIYEDIALYDTIMHNMGNLTFRANQDVMEVQNLDQLFSTGSVEQQQRFWAVMQAQSVMQSNFGTRLINKGDSFYNHQYTFSGFDHVTEAAQLNLSAKTHIPMTKLFGRSPAGMNATGESDMKNYYDIVDGQRELKLRPVLERILPVLCMSTWGKVPEDIQITFPPLWTPNAKEIAEIAGAKASAIISAFQSGLLNQGPAMAELKKLEDETGMFGSIDDALIEQNKDKTFQDTQQMDDPLAGLMGEKESEEEPVTQDFNPYHDKANGQFTFANGENAVAPIRGKTDNGQRLLNMYKERNGGKKSDMPARESKKDKQAEEKQKPAETGAKLPQELEECFTEENLQNLDKLEEQIAIARFNETVPEDVLDELEGWVKDARKAAEAAAERKATSEAAQKGIASKEQDFKKINNAEALEMAEEMGQTPEQLGDDYTQVTGWKGYFGTSNSFKLNSILRNGDGYDDLNSIDRKTVDAMDRNMAPLSRSIKTQRMVDSEGILESMRKQGIPTDESCVGKVFMDGGFVSSSFNIDENVFKHRDMTMHINAPKGAMAFISPARMAGKVDEAEVVFARSSGFKITGFKTSANEWGRGQIDMYVEIVVDDELD